MQYASGKSEDFFVLESPTTEGDFVTHRVSEDWNKVGIGFAIGQKWVSRNGFVFELSVGGGRYLGSDDDEAPEGFFRGGVSVGYRF